MLRANVSSATHLGKLAIMTSHKVSSRVLVARPVTDNHHSSVQAKTHNAATRSERPLVLTPVFRDRLIETLDQVGVPVRGRLSYVASLTCRAVQTVSRWLDPDRPGLPDIESCARLCDGLGRSSDWMLGLTEAPSGYDQAGATLSAAEVGWTIEAFGALRGTCRTCETMRMAGDEMAPQIHDGDLMFVDRAADHLVGNGIYALELCGRFMVRRVENRLGAGLLLKCEKPGYADCVVKDAAAAKRMGLRVIGKVKGAVSVARFWRQ
jgi:Peptidase S24-like